MTDRIVGEHNVEALSDALWKLADDPPQPHWFSDEHDDAPPPENDYCWECARQYCAEHGLDESIIDGDPAQEGCGPDFCDSCHRLLAYSLDDPEQELQHHEQFSGEALGLTDPITAPQAAYQLATLVDRCHGDPQWEARLSRLLPKIADELEQRQEVRRG